MIRLSAADSCICDFNRPRICLNLTFNELSYSFFLLAVIKAVQAVCYQVFKIFTRLLARFCSVCLGTVRVLFQFVSHSPHAHLTTRPACDYRRQPPTPWYIHFKAGLLHLLIPFQFSYLFPYMKNTSNNDHQTCWWLFLSLNLPI